ncbi:MAG: winged helix-turn-helix domain-containing protein [Nitrososphaeraceae archaeon]
MKEESHLVLTAATMQDKNNNKHRSRTELIASILGAATSVLEGELSTRIMYRVNTSQKNLKEYLGSLLNFELLEYESNSRRYKITEGSKFLELYSRVKQDLKTLNKKSNGISMTEYSICSRLGWIFNLMRQ